MKRQKVRSKMGVKEKALTAASSIASGDFLRMVTSAGAARKIDYSKLAKAIVEEYNGSTIAGSAQTLKAALDSLNSKTSIDTIDSGDLNGMMSEGVYFLSGSASNFTNCPAAATGNMVLIVLAVGARCVQILFDCNSGKSFYRTTLNNFIDYTHGWYAIKFE